MKAFKSIITAIFFTGAACVYAYPPDNAAVLYYNAMARWDAKDTMAHMMADFSKGARDPNDRIRKYVKNNDIINTVLDASQIKNCDWGIDFSRGFETELPHLYPLRKYSELLLADARFLAMDGNYEEALSRCMSSYKMARHVNDRALICYLVGNTIQRQTNDCVIWITGQMPQDVQILTRLRSQLAQIDNIPFPVQPAILGERDTVMATLSPEKTVDDIRHIMEFLVVNVKDEPLKEQIKGFDKAMIGRSHDYIKESLSIVPDAFNMPYVQGYAVLFDLSQKVTEDAKNKPEAILAEIFRSDYHKIFSTVIRGQTYNNAIKAALEVYIIKAKTGKLPDVLPANLPGDLFSGKPFLYEKTKDGFMLRCQGKDLSKDELCKYEFKVK